MCGQQQHRRQLDEEQALRIGLGSYANFGFHQEQRQLAYTGTFCIRNHTHRIAQHSIASFSAQDVYSIAFVTGIISFVNPS